MLGFVVGLRAEARIAAGFGGLVQAGGGSPEGAELAARRLIAQGATALVSFGLAGGLDPALRPGTVIVPGAVLVPGAVSDCERFVVSGALAARFGGLTGHTMLAGTAVAADVSAKRRLFDATGAHAVDLESGAVARVALAQGMAFAVVRAICDPAEHRLPPAALTALGSTGRIGVLRVLGSVAAQPGQLPALLALARDAACARRGLVGVVSRYRAASGG